jgi:hypothetical protein
MDDPGNCTETDDRCTADASWFVTSTRNDTWAAPNSELAGGASSQTRIDPASLGSIATVTFGADMAALTV